MLHRCRAAAGVIALSTAGALAAEPQPLPDLTVQQARPAEAQVLDRAAIDASGATALSEVLRLIPGVHLDRSGARGGVSSLYLRGADPNYTAIYVDGIKLNDPTNTRGGSFDFSTLAVDEIERIEVVRGPRSALWGADALAGVIHIVTRRGRIDSGPATRLGAGSRGYRQARVSDGGVRGRFDYAAGAGYLDSGEPAPESRATLRQGSAQLGFDFDGANRLRATLRHVRGALEAFPDDSGGPRHAERRTRERRDTEELAGDLTWQLAPRTGPDWQLRLTGYERREASVSPGVAPGARDPFGIPASTAHNRLQRVDWTLGAQWALGPASLGAGAGVLREQGRSDAELELLGPADFSLSRDTYAAWLDAGYGLPGGCAPQASVRLDDPDGAERVATTRARLACRWRGVDASASWGEGFKLPSFYALGNPIVGNPDLRPERSEGSEISLGLPLGAWRLEAAAFHTRYRDAVDFEEGPPPRLVNRARVSADGGELAAHGALGESLQLQAHLAYVDARIDDSAEPLRNRPRWTGGALLRWQALPELAVSAFAAHVGRNMDSSIPTGARELAAWTRLDGGAEWRPLSLLVLRLDLENLLDEDYEELVGFPGPGRTFRAQLGLEL